MKICPGKIMKNKLIHSTIVYETIDCPLCEKEKEIDRLQREIEKLRDDVKMAFSIGKYSTISLDEQLKEKNE